MTYLIMRIGTALFTPERYLVSADGIPRTSRSVLLSLERTPASPGGCVQTDCQAPDPEFLIEKV